MSLNAGGLAQMTYNPHNTFESGLGAPGSGFGSRRGGSQVKHLSMAPPANISTISERQPANGTPAPRTSRSHLLAGLRTAPKSPAFPSSAPPTEQRFGSQQNLQSPSTNYRQAVPQTAMGGIFPDSRRSAVNLTSQMLGLPEILAPPSIQIGDGMSNQDMDPDELEQLAATNQYLAAQQRALEQQLLDLTIAQRQMNLRNGMGQQLPSWSQMVQAQQLQIMQARQAQQARSQNYQLPSMQSYVYPASGLYSVYDPRTGQSGPGAENGNQNQSPPPKAPTFHHELSHSPPPTTPTFRAEVSPPPENKTQPSTRSITPPKQSPPKSNSPPSFEVNPLPPPSANAFRRNHARGLSSVTGNASSAGDGPKSGALRSGVFPPTPMTGTFGPGQNRAGDHPIRQPRGPPSLEELTAKPTSKFEGSKNFVTRQRRRAVNNLVRAGLGRRAASRGSNSIDSIGTPSSECDITFSISSSDEDNHSVGSRSDNGRPCPSPIGFERKHMRAMSKDIRNSPGTLFTSANPNRDEALVETNRGETEESQILNRKNPLITLTSAAEKRKTNTL